MKGIYLIFTFSFKNQLATKFHFSATSTMKNDIPSIQEAFDHPWFKIPA